MSDQDRLIEHEYDGIQEFDNPMPRWWVTTFWGTIIFSGLYLLNVGPIGAGAGRIAQYEADMAAWREAHPTDQGTVDSEALLALAGDHEVLEEGKEIFARTCAACHGPDGGGVIGPNLTDNAWIHGGTIAEIHAVVSEGVLAKGMPAWGRQLTPAQVNAAVAYVWSLQGTTPANPKAAEGAVVAQ